MIDDPELVDRLLNKLVAQVPLPAMTTLVFRTKQRIPKRGI